MGPAKFAINVAAVSLLLFVHTAHAEIIIERTQPAVLPGHTAYGIFWDGGGTQDWTSAAILADLTQGSFYFDPHHNNGAPPFEAFISIFPSIRYDTYFGIIGDGTNSSACGGCFPILTDTRIEWTWFNTDASNTGVVKIGNFTVTNDALGTWSIASAGEVYNGVIPEPTTLALFALAGLPMLRRHH